MEKTLSKQEWVLMEALWQKSPMFLSEIMEKTAKSVDWNRSSYLTYLKRMTDKGFIGYKTISGNRSYYPLLMREDCIDHESSYILSKLAEDSKRLLLVSMIKKCGVSGQDKEELLELIEKLDDENKE